MKRAQSLTLTGAGSKQQLTRGNYQNDKGRLLKAMRCKFTVPINNTTGGALATGLTDAQRQTLLDLFTFWVSYGKDGYLKPFDGQLGSRIHREARFAFGSEIEGYTDTSTGLMRNLPNVTTTNVTFYLPVPLGFLWLLESKDSRLLGMGRSQSKTLQIEVQLSALAIAANIAINGNVTVEMFPQTDSCKGDPWGAVPFYRQNDTANDEIEGPEGLILRISERSAVHASSVLTSINVSVDGESIHEAVSPQDTITEYNDCAYATAAGSLVDRETVLYVIAPGAPGTNLADLPAGKPKVKQVVKNLATFLASYLYLPVITESDIQSMLDVSASSLGRGKELKAASLRIVRGVPGAARLDAFMGSILFDRDDREFEQFPGFAQSPGESTMRLMVPDALRERASRAYKGHMAAGEQKAAAEIVKNLASAVPGAVSGARGFSRGGSKVLDRVSQLFG